MRSETIPSVVLEDRSPKELREQRRRRLDVSPEHEPDISEEDYDTNVFTRFVAQLNEALRTLDVMGQIVKNFSGSLIGKVKFELVDECYRLGLRIEGFVLDQWKDDPEKSVNEMVDVILESFKEDKELQATTREKIAGLVRGLFFFLTEATALGIIQRISHAVAAVELVPTYREVLEANPTNSFKLVDMSVRLDTLKLPTKDVVSLGKELKSNFLCTRVLRRLVVHHLYLFPTDYKTRQQICEALEIPIKEARGIDAVYENQKRLPEARGA